MNKDLAENQSTRNCSPPGFARVYCKFPHIIAATDPLMITINRIIVVIGLRRIMRKICLWNAGMRNYGTVSMPNPVNYYNG